MLYWRYGVFEFHFFDGELITLWCDHLDIFCNPRKKQFKYDKWIFQNKYHITLAKFMSILKDNGLEYELFTTNFEEDADKTLPPSIIMNIKGNDVIIYFEDEDESASNISIHFNSNRSFFKQAKKYNCNRIT